MYARRGEAFLLGVIVGFLISAAFLSIVAIEARQVLSRLDRVEYRAEKIDRALRLETDYNREVNK